ncbi:ABC transporter substrate-binding protein [Streptomyces sp. SID13726]|uniref:nSTAND3 domain-containing NTPase n=1 Tax=Streptomyces sp. SID13726 TaxID=2706058 RepID=UPI0013BC60E4|nr:ABC transporter substrate-binding protein [Streptomyces sp. SID13726]NEB05210.1 ABC transporter substrate-binding protein [Streptomyces sp. SID13726]
MTETVGSFFGQTFGSVHSGGGNQYNFLFQEAASRLREQARRRTIAEEDRTHLAERFVPPPGLQRARARLEQSHTVLISGPSGSGRRTAALMLLHDLAETGGTLHELPDTSDDDTVSSPLDTRAVNDGDRLLLDLSEVEEARYIDVQNALSDFRAGLGTRGAHLAVVLPHRLGYLLKDELKRLTVEIGRPPARRVLARRLRCDGVPFEKAELNESALGKFLTHASMRDVADLADGIRKFRDSSPADRGFPHWLADALPRQQDQSARVATDLAGEQSGRHKALLLSLAVFHETAPGAVLQAANFLLGLLSHPPDTTPRLDRADLHTELSAITAETSANGRVSFSVPEYDRGVRNHFWTYLPDIRRQLRDWFQVCLTELTLSADDRTGAVNRFAEQSLRTDRPEDLTWLAEQWTSRQAPVRLIPDAAQVLARGLDDERHGRYFRQRIYDWATSGETVDRLRQVLVVVCAETMARSHPDQALVRLHHLARRSSGQVAADARAALLRLTGSDRRLYRRMLDRLSTGIAHGPWGKDRDLFLELADPVRLIGYRDVRDSLVSCWTGVLLRPVDSWCVPLSRWLTAAEDVRHRDLVLRVLSASCARDVRVSGQLYRVALRWAGAGGGAERPRTVAHLLRRINSDQGIETYDHAV